MSLSPFQWFGSHSQTAQTDCNASDGEDSNDSSSSSDHFVPGFRNFPVHYLHRPSFICAILECKVWRNPMNLLRGAEYQRYQMMTAKQPLTYYDMNLSAQDHQNFFTCDLDQGKPEYDGNQTAFLTDYNAMCVSLFIHSIHFSYVRGLERTRSRTSLESSKKGARNKF